MGLLIQNKNFYNFTTTMATNPKVAHIYRRSNKLHRLDSRVYYYDNNFRGNMFYFEQSLLLTKCHACRLPTDRPACQGPMCTVVEELFLRNCFKQDHLLVRRFCCISSALDSAPQGSQGDEVSVAASAPMHHHHDAAVPIILQYFQQRDKYGIGTFAGQLGEGGSGIDSAACHWAE